MAKDRYISIDIETTGLDSDQCQILEIGAVIEDWKSPLNALPTFQCYVQHDTYYGEACALAMNKRIFEILAGNVELPQVPPRQLANGAVDQMHKIFHAETVGGVFTEWLDSNGFGLQNKIVVAGKNFGPFDLQFLKQLFSFAEVVSRFHHRYIDPTMLYFDPNIDCSPPSLKKCLSRIGVTNVLTHDAVVDANSVIRLVRHYYDAKRNLR